MSSVANVNFGSASGVKYIEAKLTIDAGDSVMNCQVVDVGAMSLDHTVPTNAGINTNRDAYYRLDWDWQSSENYVVDASFGCTRTNSGIAP
jgi:hypothetical protein